ncbi:MAG: bifunctional folylpolyglutamate synthase/dihydrofolate synthase [Myxococcales bacterium]|nr:bifunctional folylpolyglutamate synthase/dihydrofolate synthase [Myxococcales bacterium]
MQEALLLVGQPERDLRVVHIAGTNGKGSTAAMLESIARQSGLRTGLYSSPHLSSFSERIRLDGEPIDDERFVLALERALDPGLPPLSLFETMTLAAFLAVKDAKVELLVLEVGLGGRLDATNVIARPLCTAITSIALDHQGFLGDTVSSIGREKAGICRSGVPLVVAPLDAEAARAVSDEARARGAELMFIDHERRSTEGSLTRASLPREHGPASGDDVANVVRRLALVTDGARGNIELPDGDVIDLVPGLAGAHQLENAAVAAVVASIAARTLPRLRAGITSGIATARWPGRLERLEFRGHTVLLDCAHNVEGARCLAAYVAQACVEPARTLLVFGALDDKAHDEMLAIVAPLGRRRHYCRPIDPIAGRRAAEPLGFAKSFAGECHDKPADALAAAVASANHGDLVLVTGSIFLVGAARAFILDLAHGPAMPL